MLHSLTWCALHLECFISLFFLGVVVCYSYLEMIICNTHYLHGSFVDQVNGGQDHHDQQGHGIGVLVLDEFSERK